jgi:hypothetical protein
MMSGFSMMHWLVMLVVLAIFGVPMWKILRRAGHSGWWVIVFFIPLVNIIAIWVFAFGPWPALRAGAASQSAPD